MASNKKIALIYSAGLIHGTALVAFPAASTIFTSASQFNFSSTAYGGLFLPQAIAFLYGIIETLNGNWSFAIALLLAFLPSSSPYSGIFVFGLAGFGCSALLTLTISLGSIQLKSIASSVPGGLIAFYLFGYGVAAFGAGPLEEWLDLTLRQVFSIGAIIALALGCLTLVVSKGQTKEGFT